MSSRFPDFRYICELGSAEHLGWSRRRRNRQSYGDSTDALNFAADRVIGSCTLVATRPTQCEGLVGGYLTLCPHHVVVGDRDRGEISRM